jgi:heme oxygenase (biliverdin-IX-beta and delta-forming)
MRLAEAAETSPATEPASSAAWLRDATRVLHDRAEAHAETAVGGIDAAAYARLLAALLPLYGGIEEALESFHEWSRLDPPLDIVARRRSQLLVADLHTLGVEVQEGREHAAAAPRLELFDHALGALYVVEGSRLGGRVLAARIVGGSRSIEVDAFRFLRSDGFDVGGSWRELRASLAAYAVDPPTRARVVAGATETFACFEQQLARWAS